MRNQWIWICSLAFVLSAYGCSDNQIISNCSDQDCLAAENPDANDSTEGDNNTTAKPDPNEDDRAGVDQENPDIEIPDEPCTGTDDCADVQASCDICTDGEKKCDGNELVICQKNAENCLDWAVMEDCAASDKKCDSQSRSCIGCAETCHAGEKKCASNGIAECTPDADGCAAWTVNEICGAGTFCDEATVSCIPGCTDECKDGETKCGDTEIYACQKGESGCYTWVESEKCEFGKICTGTPAKCDYACGDDCEPFSLVLLPDTQNYTRTANGIYKKQTDWIVKNQKALNIRFVLHMGDVTNDNTKVQYQRAIAAHDVLNKAGIPYSVATGNHEYKKGDSGKKFGSRSRTLFANYFNDNYIKNGFKDSSWFHGFKSTGSMYATFEVGNLKFAVVALEYAPRKDLLCWADNLIQTELKDRYVIITTHGYLSRGATEAANDYTTGYSSGAKPAYTPFGHTGGEVFAELAGRHSNVIMVAGGHVFGIEHRNRPGFNGNSVHETLVDYQAEKPCTSSSCVDSSCEHANDAGNGWMRILTIDPKNTMTADGTLVNNVSATTVSVLDYYQKKGIFYCSSKASNSKLHYYDAKLSGQDHTYQFAFDFSKPIHYQYSTNNDISFGIRDINSDGSGNQYVPAIAVNRTSGSFVAVWEDDHDSADGEGNHDIEGRIFCAGGCQDVKQFTINSTKSGQQRNPDVAMDKDGNFVVVWEDDNDANGTYQIYMRGFDAKGNERFATKTVNSEAAGQQYKPSIAMAPDGNFVVAWEDQSVSKDTPQIYIRGFKADGSELFHDKNVMDKVEGTRKAGDIAMADDGSFVVTWQDDGDGNGTYQVYARGFNADGSGRLPAFAVNTVAKGQQLNPSIGMNASGSFFIAYEDDSDGNGKYLIKARGFDKEGKQIFADTTLSKSGEQTADPVVCVADDNKAVFGWTAKALNENDVQRRVVQKDMTIAAEDTVNRVTEGPQNSPALGCTANGKHVFLFSDDDDQNGSTEIFGRGYNG